MKTPKKHYEAPQAEIIKIELQGMLCVSGGGGGITNMGYSSGYGWSAGAGGGTSNMGYTSGYDWSIGAGAGAVDMGYGSGYGW